MYDSEGKPTRPANEPASISLAERADAVVIAVAGELDYTTTPSLRKAIADALDRLSTRPLVLDLTGVTLLGSAGLATLVDSAAEAEHQLTTAGPFRIVVDGTRPVIRSIQVSGLDQLLKLYHDVEDALADHQ
ncbi:anti-sigma factor antagonist [Pseudonocardia kujensis]|uniref:anti-sigma factor antagonist n=1 Tax=Pseudonocardia kujensis TaxID=1128675 RepID=UPI001E4C5570|nr:anti-sigma factor antagonist [Pseudonocardia kujensis]MCE0761878.1 anti-sigma factor antagonist [Pseudonocardia kujensis]